MTTPQSQDNFRQWLDEQIETATQNVKDNSLSGGDCNSYGAGYDSGWRGALILVREYFTGDAA